MLSILLITDNIICSYYVYTSINTFALIRNWSSSEINCLLKDLNRILFALLSKNGPIPISAIFGQQIVHAVHEVIMPWYAKETAAVCTIIRIKTHYNRLATSQKLGSPNDGNVKIKSTWWSRAKRSVNSLVSRGTVASIAALAMRA